MRSEIGILGHFGAGVDVEVSPVFQTQTRQAVTFVYVLQRDSGS
jgi:hypothetical protein